MPVITSHIHDIIIVGGGPAGLHVAHLLAARGWDVALFEEHPAAGEPVHCTGVLAAEAYGELDIPREPVLNSLTEVRFFAPSGEAVTYTTPEVEALVIDRRQFDTALHARAHSAGVRITTGARVTDIAVEPAGVRVSFAGVPDVRGRAAILACGANYTLQRRLGMGMPSVFLQSAQVECEAAALDAVEVHFGGAVAPKGFAWAVPVRRGGAAYARIGLMSEGNARQHFHQFVERIGERWGLTRAEASSAAVDPRLKMLPLAPIRRTYTDRIVAIGDAAGLVKATTGGGIYYSLVSASIAADVLGDALTRDALRSSDLEEYQRQWRKRLGPELRAQLSLRLLANRLSDAAIDELFELAQTDGIMPIVRRTARFNEHRGLILSLLKHPPARRVFFRKLHNWRQSAAL